LLFLIIVVLDTCCPWKCVLDICCPWKYAAGVYESLFLSKTPLSSKTGYVDLKIASHAPKNCIYLRKAPQTGYGRKFCNSVPRREELTKGVEIGARRTGKRSGKRSRKRRQEEREESEKRTEKSSRRYHRLRYSPGVMPSACLNTFTK